MTDEEITLSSLHRALEANLKANPHAPIHFGRSTVFMGQAVQALLMMKPCRCGAHISQAMFFGTSPTEAMREARKFVEALVKKDDGDAV